MKFKDNILFKTHDLERSINDRCIERYSNHYSYGEIYSYEDGVNRLLLNLFQKTFQHIVGRDEVELNFKNGDEIHGEYYPYEVFEFLRDRDIKELKYVSFDHKHAYYFKLEKDRVEEIWFG